MASQQYSESNTELLENSTNLLKLKHPSHYLKFYIQDFQGDTLLHILMARLPENDHLVQYLIDVTWPASLLNIINTDHMTALHLGAMGNKPERVRQLLVAGANPRSTDRWGCTPLHYACRSGNEKMVIALTKAFTKQEIRKLKFKQQIIPDLTLCVHVQNTDGETPLYTAVEYGHLGTMKLLLNLGAKLDSRQRADQCPPLYIAIMRGHKDIVKFILRQYKNNPDKNFEYKYCYPELIKPLRLMGLNQTFFQILKIPFSGVYPEKNCFS